MTRTDERQRIREVKQQQVARAQLVRSPQFLDHRVRPHLGQQAPPRGGVWTTEVVQLDGTGAATVKIQLDGGPPVFAKLFPFDDGPTVHALLRALRAAGLGEGQRYQAVEPLAWFPAEQVLLCRGAPGRAVSELVGGDVAELAGATAEAGRWLARLHGTGLSIGTPKPLLVASELTSLTKRLAKACAEHPEHLDLALAMLAELDALTHETVDGQLAQSHGQYRPIHVFCADDVVTVIDLDRSGPADPARDVAEFLHRLRVGVHVATGDVDRADVPCAAFLDAYQDSPGGTARLANLRFHRARYLFHTVSRLVKDADPASGADQAELRLYRAEFDHVVAQRVPA